MSPSADDFLDAKPSADSFLDQPQKADSFLDSAVGAAKKVGSFVKENVVDPMVDTAKQAFPAAIDKSKQAPSLGGAAELALGPLGPTLANLGDAAMETLRAPFEQGGDKVATSLAAHGVNPYVSAAAGTATALAPDIAFSGEGIGAVKAASDAAAESALLERIHSATDVTPPKLAEPAQIGYKAPLETPTTVLPSGDSIPLDSNASKLLRGSDTPLLEGPKETQGAGFTVRDKPDLAKVQSQDAISGQPKYPEEMGSATTMRAYVGKRRLSSNIPELPILEHAVHPEELYNPTVAEVVDESRKQYLGLDKRLEMKTDPDTGRMSLRLKQDPILENRTATAAEVSASQSTKASPVVKALDMDPRLVDATPKLPASEKAPVIKPGVVSGSSNWIQTVWNRVGLASESVVENMGAAGKDLAKDIRDVRDIPAVRYGSFSADFTKALGSMSRVKAKAVSEVLADALEGKPNKHVNVELPEGLLEFIQGKLKKIADDSEGLLKVTDSSGQARPFAPKGNYYPRMFRPEILDGILSGNDKVLTAIAKKMVQNKTEPNFSIAFERAKSLRQRMNFSKYGHLERAREFTDVPEEFYDRNALRVIPEYIKTALYRIQEAKSFGANGELAMEKINQIAEDGHDHNLARRVIERFTHIEPRDTLALQAVQGLRNVTAGMYIQWQSTIKHLPQYLAPAYEATIFGAAKNFVKAFTAMGKDEAARAGQVFETAAQQYLGEVYGGAPGPTRKLANAVFKINGMTKLIEFLKRYSALTGKDHLANNLVPRLLKNNASKSARLDLMNLGFDPAKIIKNGGLSEEELNVGAKRFTDNVTGAVDTTRLPHFWTSPTGKFFAQFKNLSYAMGRQNLSLIKRALQTGDVGRISKLMVGSGMAGYAVKKFLQSVGGQSEDTPDITSMDGANELIQDLSEGTLWGPVIDLTLNTLKGPKYVESWFTPPAIRSGTEIVNAMGSLVKGDPTPITKQVLRRVPVVGRTIEDLVGPQE